MNQIDQQIINQDIMNKETGESIMTKNIISWVNCDNKIKEYNDKCKQLREERDKLGLSMIETIPDSNDLPTYNITEFNTSLSFQNTKTYENYTNKFYTECFTEFLGSEDKSKELIEFMKNKRKVESKITLKRGYLMDM